MIGINFKKSLVVAGAALAIASLPALSLAHPYTGTTPPSIAMMGAATPVKTVSTSSVNRQKKSRNGVVKLTKHKGGKKHKKHKAKKHSI